jgi:hypothetical protein
MTSQYHYQLDTEYRKRTMAAAEKARLVEQAQPEKQQRNLLGAFIKIVQRIILRLARVQGKPTAHITDTQIQQSPANF